MKEIVNRIDNERVSKKMSQSEFCKKIGIHKQVYTDWKAERSKTYLTMMEEIAKVLNCSTHYLQTGEESPAEELYRKYLNAPIKVRKAIDILIE